MSAPVGTPSDAAAVAAMMTAFFGPHWKIPAMKEFTRVNQPKMARALAAARQHDATAIFALRADVARLTAELAGAQGERGRDEISDDTLDRATAAVLARARGKITVKTARGYALSALAALTPQAAP